MRPAFAQFGAELHDLFFGSLICSFGALSPNLRLFEIDPGKNAFLLELCVVSKTKRASLTTASASRTIAVSSASLSSSCLVEDPEPGPGLIHQCFRLPDPELVIRRIDFGQDFLGFDLASEIYVKLNDAARGLDADGGLLFRQ